MQFPGEGKAVREVVDAGARFGFGNMIDRLRMAWAAHLLRLYPDWGIESAMGGAHITDRERIRRCATLSRDDFLRECDDYTHRNS